MEGRLVIALDVGPDGKVLSAKTTTSTGNLTEDVVQCILKAGKERHLSEGPGAITFPVNFTHQK
jgi:hypothetical protein